MSDYLTKAERERQIGMMGIKLMAHADAAEALLREAERRLDKAADMISGLYGNEWAARAPRATAAKIRKALEGA